MLLESDILRLFFTGPYLVSSPLCSVSGVDCPSVVSSRNSLSALLPPTLLSPANSNSLLPPTHQLSSLLSNYQLPLSGSRRQLSFASPYHFRIRRDFFVQESFVWFRAKTDSSALAAYPHSATYLPLLPLSFILNKLQHDLTTSKKTRTFTGSKNRTYKILKGFGRPLKKNNK